MYSSLEHIKKLFLHNAMLLVKYTIMLTLWYMSLVINNEFVPCFTLDYSSILNSPESAFGFRVGICCTLLFKRQKSAECLVFQMHAQQEIKLELHLDLHSLTQGEGFGEEESINSGNLRSFHLLCPVPCCLCNSADYLI